MLVVLMLTSLAFAHPWTPSEPAQTVIEALQPRHPTVDCTSLAASLPSAEQALAEVVEHAVLPPWLPLRAATCLAQLPEPPVELLTRWTLNPSSPALARVAVRHLDRLPEHVASQLLTDALKGPHAELIRQQLEAASPTPEAP